LELRFSTREQYEKKRDDKDCQKGLWFPGSLTMRRQLLITMNRASHKSMFLSFFISYGYTNLGVQGTKPPQPKTKIEEEIG
jgi:hypothetical protein